MSWNGGEHKVLLRNEGIGSDGIPHFVDIHMAVGGDETKDGRGMALLDFDHDGDLDVAINHSAGDSGRAELALATLLRNDLGENRSWVEVELTGTRSNRDGVGAQVVVESGGHRQLRLATEGSGYASQHTRRLHFGLADAERLESMTVTWPSGEVQRFTDLPARQLLRVVEGGGVEAVDLPVALPHPATSKASGGG